MIDCTSVVVTKDTVEISGTDISSIWLFSDEPVEEDAACTEVTYRFDTTLAGVRKYLYVVTKNNKKASEFRYMDQRLEALLGQTIQLSDNFRVKD